VKHNLGGTHVKILKEKLASSKTQEVLAECIQGRTRFSIRILAVGGKQHTEGGPQSVVSSQWFASQNWSRRIQSHQNK
jgi:hypothetical protein